MQTEDTWCSLPMDAGEALEEVMLGELDNIADGV